MARDNRISPLLPIWPTASVKAFEHKPGQAGEARRESKMRERKKKGGKEAGSRLDTWA